VRKEWTVDSVSGYDITNLTHSEARINNMASGPLGSGVLDKYERNGFVMQR
jgi:hypothetical protein